MKTLTFILLALVQVLLPVSFHTSSSPSLAPSKTVHAVSQFKNISKNSPTVSVSSFENKDEFSADEINLEDSESFLKPIAIAINPHATTETPEALTSTPCFDIENFTLVYISRFSTSPPAEQA